MSRLLQPGLPFVNHSLSSLAVCTAEQVIIILFIVKVVRLVGVDYQFEILVFTIQDLFV